VVSAIVAALTFVLTQCAPFGGGPKRTDAVASTSTATTTAAIHQPATGGPAPSAATEYLNTIEPDKGRSNLVALPDKLPSTVDRSHALTIGCPSNQTGDQVREITYALNQRYATFEATVVASFDPAKDWTVGVVPLVGVLQRDGTVQTQETGAKRGVTMATSTPVSVPVKGAQELTLQISCERPDGVVVLADARITRAS
jgi:hypothetical protein